MSQKRLFPSGRLLVLSYFYPPMSAGPTFVIRALLGQLDPKELTVFSGDPMRYPLHRDPSVDTGVPARRYDVPSWWPLEDRQVQLGRRAMRVRVRAFGNILVAFRVALAAASELRKSDTRALLVVYPKQHFLLAGCLAALLSRKPLLVYFMDVYVEGLEGGRRTARLIERAVAARAAVVFAMSDPHRKHLEKALASRGRRPRVVELPHPYDEEDACEGGPFIDPNARPAIVFTGAVYDAQADAIRRLIAALASPELIDVHLHLVTQTSFAVLSEHGIEPSERVHVTSGTRSDARAAQRAADVLFLPIAFDAKGHVRRTASPSKMPEYLASGRPILVHAPPDSYVAQYAAQNGFALVVTDADESELRAAVRSITTDAALRDALSERAHATLERHRADRVADILRDEITALA